MDSRDMADMNADFQKGPASDSAIVKLCSAVFWPKVQYGILGVIILNALILGIETAPLVTAHIGNMLHALDTLCLVVFIVELTMKCVVLRFSFFKSGWNVFDFIIVGIALVPDGGALSILRALRILRVLRLVTNLPRLRVIVESVLHSLPSIGWISCLLGLIFYIFSVLTTTLFGAQFQEWFGSLGASLYTLFQVLTLESWSMGIVRPVMEQFPHAWLIFIPFILLTSFIVLNVFIGIIVYSMGEVSAGSQERNDAGKADASLAADPGAICSTITVPADIMEELSFLKEHIARLETMVKTSGQ
jgi:voltage-gated sodium channel